MRTLVDELRDRPIHVSVVGVSALPSVDEDAWRAVVILHTTENQVPPAPVRSFLERGREPGT